LNNTIKFFFSFIFILFDTLGNNNNHKNHIISIIKAHIKGIIISNFVKKGKNIIIGILAKDIFHLSFQINLENFIFHFVSSSISEIKAVVVPEKSENHIAWNTAHKVNNKNI
jgi:hypothetical protein